MLWFSSKAQHLAVAVSQVGAWNSWVLFLEVLSIRKSEAWASEAGVSSWGVQPTLAPGGPHLAWQSVLYERLVCRQKNPGKSHCWWRHRVPGPAVHFRIEVDTAGMQTSQSISKSVGAETGGNHPACCSPIPASFLTACTGLTPLTGPRTGVPDWRPDGGRR